MRTGGDGDLLPVIDGDAQDKEWEVARPLYVYISADRAVGGRGYYVEFRSVWSDESRFTGAVNHVYFLVRWSDDTSDISRLLAVCHAGLPRARSQHGMEAAAGQQLRYGGGDGGQLVHPESQRLR